MNINDVKILKEWLESDKEFAKKYKIEKLAMQPKLWKRRREALEKLLQQNEVYEDRMNTLRDKIQENEVTIKNLTNIFANEKQEYLNRIKELEDKKQQAKEFENQIRK